jgi:hypothetical protein
MRPGFSPILQQFETLKPLSAEEPIFQYSPRIRDRSGTVASLDFSRIPRSSKTQSRALPPLSEFEKAVIIVQKYVRRFLQRRRFQKRSKQSAFLPSLSPNTTKKKKKETFS